MDHLLLPRPKGVVAKVAAESGVKIGHFTRVLWKRQWSKDEASLVRIGYSWRSASTGFIIAARRAG